MARVSLWPLRAWWPPVRFPTRCVGLATRRSALGGECMTGTIDEQLLALWQRTDRIFAAVRDEAFLHRPIALRHPFIFYVGHLPAFAWIHVCQGALERPAFAPEFDDM